MFSSNLHSTLFPAFYSPCCKTWGVTVYFVGDTAEGLVDKLTEEVRLFGDANNDCVAPTAEAVSGDDALCCAANAAAGVSCAAAAPEWMIKCCPVAVRTMVGCPEITWPEERITFPGCCWDCCSWRGSLTSFDAAPPPPVTRSGCCFCPDRAKPPLGTTTNFESDWPGLRAEPPTAPCDTIDPPVSTILWPPITATWLEGVWLPAVTEDETASSAEGLVVETVEKLVPAPETDASDFDCAAWDDRRTEVDDFVCSCCCVVFGVAVTKCSWPLGSRIICCPEKSKQSQLLRDLI